jgi:hypothetical protein
MSRDFRRGDEAYGKDLIAGVLPTLDEDMFATGEIEKMLSRFDSVPQEVLLHADTTCVSGRRLFEVMIRSENQSSTPTPVETCAAKGTSIPGPSPDDPDDSVSTH